jgi:hypothetical protein
MYHHLTKSISNFRAEPDACGKTETRKSGKPEVRIENKTPGGENCLGPPGAEIYEPGHE